MDHSRSCRLLVPDSAAAPIIAGSYALAGNAASIAGSSGGGTSLYANRSSLNDTTGGSNGTCSASYLCTAALGYDGPTGLGTPAGVAAFSA